MEISRHLRSLSAKEASRQQLFIAAFARAMEIIPRQLCDNAGFDSTNILNKLRARHADGEIPYSDFMIFG